jgi:hypothetical protein
MAEDKPARWPSTTITRRAFLSSSAVAVGTLAAVTACGGGGDSSAPVGAAPSPAPGPAPSPAPSPGPPPAPLPPPGTPPSDSYSTTFDLTENPISEGGRWFNNGTLWTKVRTANVNGDGLAFGTQLGNPLDSYNDSYAYLSGFRDNQQGEAVIYVDPGLVGEPHEVELLLRWSDSAQEARGYECLFHHNGIVQIMRWNGPFGDFTPLATDQLGRALRTGDVIKATAIGSVITAYINGVPILQVSDLTYPTGQPGIAFFKRVDGLNTDLAISSYTASSL